MNSGESSIRPAPLGWLLLGFMFLALVGADAQARTLASALLENFNKLSLWKVEATRRLRVCLAWRNPTGADDDQRTRRAMDG